LCLAIEEFAMENRLNLLARRRGSELVEEFVSAPQEDPVLRRFFVNIASNAVELRRIDCLDHVLEIVLHEWEGHVANLGFRDELLLAKEREFELGVVRIAKVEIRPIRINVGAQVQALDNANVEKSSSVLAYETLREVGKVLSKLVTNNRTLIYRIYEFV